MGEKIVIDQSQQLAPEAVSAQSVALLVIYLLAIVVGIYFLTKLIAKKSLKRGIKKPGNGARWFSSNKAEPGRLIGVVDRIALDRDKTLTVVEFEGRYYMLGVTHQEIKLLDKVSIPEADRAAADEGAGGANARGEGANAESGGTNARGGGANARGKGANAARDGVDTAGEANNDINGAERSADTDDAAFYAVQESSFSDYLKQLGMNMKLGIYRFFHRGKNPPKDFDTQLKEKLETGKESAVQDDSSEKK